MNLPYSSARDVARELKEKHFPGFHDVLYDRFRPDQSRHAWLVPKKDRTYFRYGKASFSTDEAWGPEGMIFCGFNFEKGPLHPGAWPDSNIMDETWFWHRFLKIANLPLKAAIEESQEAIQEQLQMVVVAVMLGDEGSATFAKVDLTLAGPEIKEYRKPKNPLATPVLSDFAECQTFAQLADALKDLDGPRGAWHWLDVFVGCPFSMDPDGADDTSRCAHMLKPFERWMILI